MSTPTAPSPPAGTPAVPGTQDGSAEPTGSTGSTGSTGAALRSRWTRWRKPILAGAALLALLVVAYVLSGPQSQERLDPATTQPDGAHAIAELLDDNGVEVDRVTSIDRAVEAAREAGSDSTFVVSDPDLLTTEQAGDLADAVGGDLVLLRPRDKGLEGFGVPVFEAGSVLPADRAPGCSLPAAERAGDIRVEGSMYRTGQDGATTCYGDGTRSALVRLDTGDHTTTVLGSTDILTNERLDEQGHAALGLNLLGAHERLVWYVPSPGDLPDDTLGAGPRSMSDLVPDGVRLGIVQLAIAVLLLMIASARRLGPVVSEALPVVVRASEAVEGRARLYRRGRARASVAESLRQATRQRMAPTLGLAASADQHSVVAAVAGRTRRTPTEIEALLYGTMGSQPANEPTDDAALVRFADQLDALEQEVRRS